MASTVIHFGWSVISVHWVWTETQVFKWRWWQCCSVVASFLTARSTVPVPATKRIYLQSSCQYPTNSSGFWVKFLKICRCSLRLHWKISASTAVECCSKNLFKSQSWTCCVLSQNFKLLSSSCLFPRFSWGKHLITTLLRFFWGTSRLNYKTAKRPTHFSPTQSFLWNWDNLSLPFR